MKFDLYDANQCFYVGTVESYEDAVEAWTHYDGELMIYHNGIDVTGYLWEEA